MQLTSVDFKQLSLLYLVALHILFWIFTRINQQGYIALQQTVRPRVERLIEERYGAVTKEAIRLLAEAADMPYTTIARFLGYTATPTQTMRRSNLAKLAVALDTSETWFLDGQGAEQRGLWPIVVHYQPEPGEVEPVEQVETVLGHVARLPKLVALKACRAATAAILEVVVSNGTMVPGEAYECLVRLDAQHRTAAQA